MAITTQQQSNIIALTVGMFNAAPGAQFLSEFADIFENNGQSYQALADALASTGQYQSQFAGLVTQEGRVNKILSNLGIEQGTDAYTEAKAHFDARIAQGATETELVVESLEYLLGDNAAAEFADVQAQLANRVEVATYFSVEKQQSATTLSELQSVVASVTADEATVTAAKEAIDSGATSPDQPGQTFTLTDAISETVTGTANNDTFTAVADATGITGGETFNVGDTIDGAGGTDTFNLLATSAAAGINGRTSDVEVINLTGELAGDGFASVDASRFDGAEQIWQINGAAAGVSNVATGTTIGFRDVALVAGGVAVANGVAAASIALDNVTTGGTLALGETTANDLVTVNVSGSVAGAGALTVDLDTAATVGGTAPSAEETLNLALTSDGAISITSTTLTTVDASESTGDLTIDLSGAPSTSPAVNSLIGGSGDDTLTTVGLAAGEVVEGGKGADSITISAGGATTVVVGEGDTGITASTIDDITGFVSGTDKLAFGLADGSATNFVDGGVSSSFVDAQTNANTAFDGTLQYFFSDDGANGFLFLDRDLDGTADEAIQLTGVTALTAADIVDAA